MTIKSISNAINEAKGNNIDKPNISRTKIIPFGKYKGQSVEVLASDPSYVNYIQKDDWVKKNYPDIHTIIINNFQEPNETPEHNSLQVLFLETDFCNKFCEVVNPNWKSIIVKNNEEFIKNTILNNNKNISDIELRIKKTNRELENIPNELISSTKEATSYSNPKRIKWAEAHKYDTSSNYYDTMKKEFLEQLELDVKRNITFKENQLKRYIIELDIDKRRLEKENQISEEKKEWKLEFNQEFEHEGVDVKLNGKIYYEIGEDRKEFYLLDDSYYPIRIEIKPKVGDDYPAVIRQMRINKSNILFLEKYTGQGATLSQFVKTFELSNIRVIFKHEVDKIKLEE